MINIIGYVMLGAAVNQWLNIRYFDALHSATVGLLFVGLGLTHAAYMRRSLY